jgi:hypothetical protein
LVVDISHVLQALALFQYPVSSQSLHNKIQNNIPFQFLLFLLPRQALIISTYQIAPLALRDHRLIRREQIREEHVGALLVELNQLFLAEREDAAEN